MSITISYNEMHISLVMDLVGASSDSFLVTGSGIRQNDELTIGLMRYWGGRWNDHSHGFVCANKDGLLERVMNELSIQEHDLGASRREFETSQKTVETSRGVAWTIDL